MRRLPGFRARLKDTRRAVANLLPGPLLLGLLTGTGVVAGSKGAALKVGATLAAVGAGAVGIGVEVFMSGDPAPLTAHSRALPGGHVAAGQPLPKGTAIVRRTVAYPAARDRRTIAVGLACPTPLRVADLIASAGTTAAYAPQTTVGASTRARVLVEPRTGARTARITMLCKAPDASGSIVAGPPRAAAAAGRAFRVRVRRAELFARPGGAAVARSGSASPSAARVPPRAGGGESGPTPARRAGCASVFCGRCADQASQS